MTMALMATRRRKHFPEVADRTFLQAIVERKNCLPATLSDPGDRDRLKALGVRYTDPVEGVKLTGATLPPGWQLRFSEPPDQVVAVDDKGVVRMWIQEKDGVPVLCVYPLKK